MNEAIANISAWTIVKAFLGILAIIGTVFGLDAYVNHKIDRRVSDEAYLKRLAERIRPSVIFDANESIIYDGGGMRHLESLTVQAGSETNDPPFTIVVTPKKHLAYAPLIDALGVNAFSVDSSRGRGNEWIVTLGGSGFMHSQRPPVFRLEILQ